SRLLTVGRILFSVALWFLHGQFLPALLKACGPFVEIGVLLNELAGCVLIALDGLGPLIREQIGLLDHQIHPSDRGVVFDLVAKQLTLSLAPLKIGIESRAWIRG